MFLLPKSLSWTGWALKEVTEGMEGCHRAIREGFLEEAMNTIESDAENDNNQHVSNTYYMPGPAP